MSTISKFAGRVVCTKAQFDALAEKDPNKEYLVTDDDTYVIAPSTDGTAGQVLKKTATGTEWANESGGGGGDTGQVIVDTCKIDGEVTKEGDTLYIQAITNVFNNNITDFASFLTATKNKTIPSNGYISINDSDPASELCPIYSIKNIYQSNSQTYLINIYYIYQNNVTLVSIEESELANFTIVVEKW